MSYVFSFTFFHCRSFSPCIWLLAASISHFVIGATKFSCCSPNKRMSAYHLDGNFGGKFPSNRTGMFFGTKNRNLIELYHLQNTGNFLLSLDMKPGTNNPNKYFFSGKFPPGWTVSFECSPEFPGFPHKWQALKIYRRYCLLKDALFWDNTWDISQLRKAGKWGLCKILKGHSQLMHMRIKYHFLADLHVTRRSWNKSVSGML